MNASFFHHCAVFGGQLGFEQATIRYFRHQPRGDFEVPRLELRGNVQLLKYLLYTLTFSHCAALLLSSHQFTNFIPPCGDFFGLVRQTRDDSLPN